MCSLRVVCWVLLVCYVLGVGWRLFGAVCRKVLVVFFVTCLLRVAGCDCRWQQWRIPSADVRSDEAPVARTTIILRI